MDKAILGVGYMNAEIWIWIKTVTIVIRVRGTFAIKKPQGRGYMYKFKYKLRALLCGVDKTWFILLKDVGRMVMSGVEALIMWTEIESSMPSALEYEYMNMNMNILIINMNINMIRNMNIYWTGVYVRPPMDVAGEGMEVADEVTRAT